MFTWRKTLSGLATLGIFLAWFVIFRPTMLGGDATYAIVSGRSMEPTYEAGDYVIGLAEDRYGEGDIVMFQVGGGVVIHRIVGGSAEDGFHTRGDNNLGTDPWQPRSESILGKAWVRVPNLGAVISGVHTPLGLGALAGSVTVLMLLLGTAHQGRHRVPSHKYGRHRMPKYDYGRHLAGNNHYPRIRGFSREIAAKIDAWYGAT